MEAEAEQALVVVLEVVVEVVPILQVAGVLGAQNNQALTPVL